MKRNVLICGSMFVAVLLSGVAVSSKAEGPGMTDRQLVEALRRAAAPTDMHKVFKTIKGKYDQAIKWSAAPDSEPRTATARCEADRPLGSTFVEVTASGKWLDFEFEGRGAMGYDSGAQEYVIVWMDTLSTRILVCRGTIDEATGAISLFGEYYDTIASKMREIKIVMTILDKKGAANLKVYDITPGSPQFMFLEIDSSRHESRAA